MMTFVDDDPEAPGGPVDPNNPPPPPPPPKGGGVPKPGEISR